MAFFNPIKIAALSIALAGSAFVMQPAHAAGDRLVIAKISSKPAKQLPRLKPMAEALAVALKPYGIKGVDVRVVPSIEAAAAAMRNGEIDMVSETVFGALELETAKVGKIELAEWKGGNREYRTIFFAKKGSTAGLANLRGRKVAFQDSGSTSGHFLPRYSLRQQGYSLVEDGQPAGRESIRYIFAGEDEINVVVTVARGIAYAGTLSNLDWEDDETVPPALKKQLTIIHETAPILRSATVLRTGLDPKVREELIKTLEKMGDDPSAAKTLKKYFKVKKFQRIGPEEEEILAGARAMVASDI